MKLQLMKEMFDLNQAFDSVMRSLGHLEKVRFFNGEFLRNVRATVDCACVDANREFFEQFEAIVENDAKWAYRFQCAYNQKIKDPEEVYFEIQKSEERRKKKGLPPRVVILPNWDLSDEERYDEQEAPKKKKKVPS